MKLESIPHILVVTITPPPPKKIPLQLISNDNYNGFIPNPIPLITPPPFSHLIANNAANNF